MLAIFSAVGIMAERLMSPYHSGCLVPACYAMQAYFYCLAAYLIIYQCGINRCCESILLPFFLGIFALIQICFIFSIIFFIINLLFKHQCATPGVWTLDSLLLIFGIVVAQPLVFLALKIYLWVALVLSRFEAYWSKVSFIFDCFIDPIIGRDKFNDALNSIPLTEIEGQLVNERCGRVQQGGQVHIPVEHRVGCPLCLQTFNAGDTIIDHPGCFDSFHSTCLLRYLTSTAASCPICRRGTRQELGLTIQRNLQRDLEQRLIGDDAV